MTSRRNDKKLEKTEVHIVQWSNKMKNLVM